MSEKDRRYLPRWNVDNKILYQRDNDLTYQACHSKDINCTGACLRTANIIETGEGLSLTIYLAENIKPVSVHGKVCWRLRRDDEHLIGVQFDRINDKTSDLIFRYAFEYKRDELMRHWFKGF